MHQITTHHDFDAPAALLWELLADFAHIERWWPKDIPAVQIERVELEGEGIGLTRHIYNKGFAAPVSERLDFQDPATLTYKLSIVGQKADRCRAKTHSTGRKATVFSRVFICIR